MRSRLPLEYALRNLGRRPLRTLLTGLSGMLVAALIAATAAFARNLDTSLRTAGDPDLVIVLSSVAERDVVRSTVSPQAAEVIAASVPGIARMGDVALVSPEIHFGTNVRLGESGPDDEPALRAFVRGVTSRAFLVHDIVTLVEGRLPGPGEVVIGELVAANLGVPQSQVAIGSRLRFENGTFTVVGRFAAPGTTTAAEIWAPLVDVQSHSRRDDVSALFIRLESPQALPALDLFARRRLDLELVAIPSEVYYAEAAAWLAPMRLLAWGLCAMIAVAAMFGGATTMMTAVADRTRELAALRTIGYSGLALARSLLTEALVLAAFGGLAGVLLARLLVDGGAVRLAMSAFALEVDAVAVLAGSIGALLLGFLGTIPALVRVLRLPIATALAER